MVRINALTAASEAACLIVSVDETIKNPRSTVDAPRLLAGAEVVAALIEVHPGPHTSALQPALLTHSVLVKWNYKEGLVFDPLFSLKVI